ncbi:PhzF family phenazine biosynthesis protein [Xylocopilactobacillus apis]|uniref:Phenazine biosynthesis protein PhzF n=1 Tax=Xylocopilactobacillus apis TaxID=2932183 RepID=A0AAU9CWP7_9LACO|nr:PhzF family phenazine biosynthesis protein [Xylocopilactobacillus apis]BDR55708.1 phenazine biosynthesis protein PhzF [Xylocopilactobacillus apis]
MSNRNVKFKEIDVFTKVPYKGNPVAVVMDGDKLSSSQMQQIANWIHLSETTFVCSPSNSEADYRLRIFTPNNELPFAGHPTIGSAHAILESGLRPQHEDYVVQECGSGLVKIYQKGEQLFLTLPEPVKNDISSSQVKQLAEALGINETEIEIAEQINVGAVWDTVKLPSAKPVTDILPNMNMLSKIIAAGVTGLTVFGPTEDNFSDFEVRSFAPNEGVDEDPVCGSGNGSVAVLIKEHHLINKNSYLATQGKCLGRDGRVEVKFTEDDQILLGGNAVSCIEGNLVLPG